MECGPLHRFLAVVSKRFIRSANLTVAVNHPGTTCNCCLTSDSDLTAGIELGEHMVNTELYRSKQYEAGRRSGSKSWHALSIKLVVWVVCYDKVLLVNCKQETWWL